VLGIFALSAALKETELEKYQAGLKLLDDNAIQYQKASNLELKEEIFSGAEYFSCGTLEQRLKGLKELKADQFLSLKGGYGVQHCLEDLDTSVFSNKAVFGYSDLTALFLKLQKDSSIKLFHSPMLTELSGLSKEEQTSFFGFLKEDSCLKKKLLSLTPGLEEQLKSQNSIFLKEPSYLWGGNLTLLLSMNVLPIVKEGYKNILFIEDCFEEAYKVERMLYTALNQGLFADIDELWLGESKEAVFNIGLLENLAQKYNFNLLTGLPFGHSKKFTLPIYHYYN